MDNKELANSIKSNLKEACIGSKALEEFINNVLTPEIMKLLAEIEKENEEQNESIELKKGQRYYYIDCVGDMVSDIYIGDSIDKYVLYHNKIWLNEEDCERYNEIDKQYRQLVWELNQENPVDWENFNQPKYFLVYCPHDSITEKYTHYSCKAQNIYCTDQYILKKAIDLIGQEDLDWYIKNYRS